MAFEEIEKLRERLARDPASKVFLPLSEEYRKAGMLDEAVEVLRKGLETHPSYMSARVALGKVYHEKGMMKEAVEELEKVTRAIPDNLFAHRKLAEIYRETGEPEKASREFEAVLGLNPLDDEARAHVQRPPVSPEPHVPEAEPAPSEPEVSVPEEGPEIEIPPLGAEDTDEAYGMPSPGGGGLAEDFEEFARSVSPDSRPYGEELPGEGGGAEAPPGEEPGEGFPGLGFGGAEEACEEAGVEEQRGAVEHPLGREDREESMHAELMRAEDFISRDEFGPAFSAYRDLLRRSPSDRHVLQKVEELRAYLRMIGRDKEEVISKLESFVSGIRRRKDEFLRSA